MNVSKWFRGLALLSALGFFGLLLAGWLLPADYTAVKSLTLNQPPEKVWEVLADYPGQAEWRPELKEVVKKEDLNGHPVWEEVYGSGGKVVFEILEAEAPKRLVKQTVASDDAPIGTWTFEIAPEAAGSKVTITEKGSIPSPIFRLLVRFFFGESAFVDGYMESLGKKFDAPAASK